MTEKELQETRDKILITMGKLLLDLHEKYIKEKEWNSVLSERCENELWDALIELDKHYKE